MKLDDIKQQPKPAAPPVNNMTEQELRIFLAQNKATILEYVKQVDKEHDAIRTKFERDGFEKSLLAAQANIDQIIKYSEQALAAVKAEVAAVDAGAKTALNHIGGMVQKVQTSNEALKEVMKAEAESLTTHSYRAVANLGEEATKGITKSIESLNYDLKEVVKTHQSIASTVKEIYAWKGIWSVVGYLGRFFTFMMLMKLCQHVFGVEGIWSWLKIWFGFALF